MPWIPNYEYFEGIVAGIWGRINIAGVRCIHLPMIDHGPEEQIAGGALVQLNVTLWKIFKVEKFRPQPLLINEIRGMIKHICNWSVWSKINFSFAYFSYTQPSTFRLKSNFITITPLTSNIYYKIRLILQKSNSLFFAVVSLIFVSFFLLREISIFWSIQLVFPSLPATLEEGLIMMISIFGSLAVLEFSLNYGI